MSIVSLFSSGGLSAWPRRRAVRACIVPLVVTAALLAAPSPASARDLILLIGNSFSSGLRGDFRRIVRSAGRDAAFSVRAVKGYSLELHLASGATLDRIQSKPWNVVVLQEQSDGFTSDRYPFARLLNDEIAATGARTMFMMTWRNRDADLADYDSLRGVPDGDEGYVPIAFELGAAIAPAGWAFRESVIDDPSVDLWGDDGHHAGERGRYIAALVLYTAIYAESPVGLWFSPHMTPAEALRDQQVVESVVLGNPTDWNIQ